MDNNNMKKKRYCPPEVKVTVMMTEGILAYSGAEADGDGKS